MSTLLERIAQASLKTGKVPKGFFTAQQWSEKWGLARPRTSELLANGIRAGIVEVRAIRVVNGRAGVRLVPHYREI